MVKKSSNRWAILIGINGYHESLGPLKYSVNDCRRLAEVLTTGDDAFQADHVLILADDEADERRPTYANIHSWLASWLAQPGEDDTVLVFFAGHGREMDGKCYLVPGDATLQTIHVTGIPVPYIQELLNRCKARQKVLILDACHSGAGRDVSTMAAPMMDALSSGKGIYTLTSCDVDEASHEWDEKNQGVFSYYLAEALSGSCPPDTHGRITAEAVYDWVYQRVRHWASGSRCSQNPKRVANASGAIVLRKADPDWKALARSLQAKLDTSEATSARLQEELNQSQERERLLVELRQSARKRMVSGKKPRTKANQKRLLKDLVDSRESSLATQDELLAIVEDEAVRAVAIRDAGKAMKLESRLKDSETDLANVRKKLAVATKVQNGPNPIQRLWRSRLSVPRFVVCAILSVGAIVVSAAIMFPLVAPSVTSAVEKGLETLQVHPSSFAFVGCAMGMVGLSTMAVAILSSRFQWWLYFLSVSTGVLVAYCGVVIASQRHGQTGYLSASGVISAMAIPVLMWAWYKRTDEWDLAVVLALGSGPVCFGLLALVGWFCGVIG